MLGKFSEEFTEWQRDSSGKLIYAKDNNGHLFDADGKPIKIKDDSLITDFGFAVTGLAANIVGVVANGANKEKVSGIIENALKLTSENINLFGTNATFQTTEIGKWFADNATGKKIAELAGNADNALISHMMITGAVFGLYMGFEQYKESTEIYDINGKNHMEILGGYGKDKILVRSNCENLRRSSRG